MPSYTHVALLTCFAVLLSTRLFAQESMADLMSARPVDSVIKLQVAGQHIEFAVDTDPEYHPIGADRLFLSSDAISLRYPAFNPLKLQIAVSEEQVDDPSDTPVTKLLEALLQVPTIINPPATVAVSAGQSQPQPATSPSRPASPRPPRAAAPMACRRLQQASDISNQLAAHLYAEEFTAGHLRTMLRTWVSLIDTTPGAQGIALARDAITTFRTTNFTGRLRAAEQLILRLDMLANDPSLQSLSTANLPSNSESYDSHVCGWTARALVSSAQLSGLRERLEELERLSSTIGALADELGPFVDGWRPIPSVGGVPHYELATIQAGGRKTITIKAATISYVPSAARVAVSTSAVPPATFVIRPYRLLTPEIGAGLVMSTLRRPIYGTTVNSEGDTVVAIAGEEAVHLSTAITVNYVCRCWGVNFAPMIQIGVSPDPETPAIMLGGGVRLFGAGNGDFALGLGRVFAWVQRLSDVSIGDVAEETTTVQQHLGFTPTPAGAWYGALMFNF